MGGSSIESDLSERWALARRTDLEYAVGIIVAVPPHMEDETGRVIWGRRSWGGVASEVAENNFREEIAQVGKRALENHSVGGLRLDRVQTHFYETGPAAQSWPDIALLFWNDVRPLLMDAKDMVELGLLVKESVALVRRLLEKLASSHMVEESSHLDFIPIDPQVALTQGAALALCVEDLLNRHGIAERLDIRIRPRGFPHYSDAKHPHYCMQYLVEFTVGIIKYVYILRSDGEFIEHFILAGNQILPQPIWDEGQPDRIDAFKTVLRGLDASLDQ